MTKHIASQYLVIILVCTAVSTLAADPKTFEASLLTAKTDKEPDKVQNEKGGPGWFWNLGPTGIRALLVDDRSKCEWEGKATSFLVKFVFPDSPANGKILPGDRIIGANGKKFRTNYPLGYWFGIGYDGPPMELGEAIETSEADMKGKLDLMVVREDKQVTVSVQIKSKGAFGENFPVGCKKSEQLREGAIAYLLKTQNDRGRWGNSCDADVAACLALLAQGDQYKRNVERYLDTVLPGINKQTWNWELALNTILCCEYYLKTLDKRYWKHMERFNDQFKENQSPNYAFCHMGYAVRDAGCYGSMTGVSSLCCLGWSMLDKCGMPIHSEALNNIMGEIDANLVRGGNDMGRYAYGWPLTATPSEYNAGAVSKDGLISLKKTLKAETGIRGGILPFGGMAFAHHFRPWQDYSQNLVKNHIKTIARSSGAVVNGHGSGYIHGCWGLLAVGALAGKVECDDAYRVLMDYHKAYINLTRCHDDTFYTQPTRDDMNGDYGRSPRILPTAVWALVLSMPQRSLYVLGKDDFPGTTEYREASDLWSKGSKKKGYSLMRMAEQKKHPFAKEALAQFRKEDPIACVGTASVGIAEKADREMRVWTAKSGATVEASLVTEQGTKFILLKPDGKRIGISKISLSAEDIKYAEKIRMDELVGGDQ